MASRLSMELAIDSARLLSNGFSPANAVRLLQRQGYTAAQAADGIAWAVAERETEQDRAADVQVYANLRVGR